VIDEEKAKSRGSFWREMPVLLGVAVLVAVLVRAFALQTFFIPSESMEHTLNIDDRVLVNKIVYDYRAPHRGEVIVFRAPMSWRANPEEKDFIKRVIAVGGDHVVCCDAQQRISVNGKPLDEPYLYHDGGANDGKASPSEFDVTVPKDRLWVMGDNRFHSGDSQDRLKATEGDVQMSTIPDDAVIGRAFVLFWPFSRGDWLTVPGTFDGVPAHSAG